jgi:hypothetical protein
LRGACHREERHRRHPHHHDGAADGDDGEVEHEPQRFTEAPPRSGKAQHAAGNSRSDQYVYRNRRS